MASPLYITKLKDGYVRVGLKGRTGDSIYTPYETIGLSIDMKGEDVIQLVRAVMAQDLNEDVLQEKR